MCFCAMFFCVWTFINCILIVSLCDCHTHSLKATWLDLTWNFKGFYISRKSEARDGRRGATLNAAPYREGHKKLYLQTKWYSLRCEKAVKNWWKKRSEPTSSEPNATMTSPLDELLEITGQKMTSTRSCRQTSNVDLHATRAQWPHKALHSVFPSASVRPVLNDLLGIRKP